MSTFTRKTLVLIIVGLLLAGGLATVALAGGGPKAAETVSPASSGEMTPGRTISVNGVGIAYAKPDVALIQLGVESVDGDAGQAISDNTERMNAVMSVLKELGIQDKDIQTVNYNMWMEQVYGRDGQPSDAFRYHVINHLRVRLNDLDRTGELLQQTLEAGANNVNGITFTVADPVALQQEARQKAIASAQAKAQELAAGLEVEVGELRQVSESGGSASPFLPVAMAEGMGGGGPVPVPSGEFSISVEIQATFEITE